MCSLAVSLFFIAPSALAQGAAEPVEGYEGAYDDHGPRPATSAEWQQRLRALEARVRAARQIEEEAERSGDEARENRAEAVVEATEAAEERFRERTSSRSPIMIVSGATLIAGGMGSLFVGSMLLTAGQGTEPTDGSDNTASVVAWAVPTVVAFAAGPTLLAIGLRRRWREPAQPEATIGLGAGRVVVRGTF
jgi:hypothetical protein